MPMRTDCRHYESRTYPSGDTVRKCRLDLAPEAPWRCPADCTGFERRTVDVAWNYGSLRTTPAESAEPEGDSEDIAAVLDAAEDIVNEVGRDLIAEFEQRESRKSFFKRRKRR